MLSLIVIAGIAGFFLFLFVNDIIRMMSNIIEPNSIVRNLRSFASFSEDFSSIITESMLIMFAFSFFVSSVLNYEHISFLHETERTIIRDIFEIKADYVTDVNPIAFLCFVLCLPPVFITHYLTNSFTSFFFTISIFIAYVLCGMFYFFNNFEKSIEDVIKKAEKIFDERKEKIKTIFMKIGTLVIHRDFDNNDFIAYCFNPKTSKNELDKKVSQKCSNAENEEAAFNYAKKYLNSLIEEEIKFVFNSTFLEEEDGTPTICKMTEMMLTDLTTKNELRIGDVISSVLRNDNVKHSGFYPMMILFIMLWPILFIRFAIKNPLENLKTTILSNVGIKSKRYFEITEAAKLAKSNKFKRD